MVENTPEALHDHIRACYITAYGTKSQPSIEEQQSEGYIIVSIQTCQYVYNS